MYLVKHCNDGDLLVEFVPDQCRSAIDRLRDLGYESCERAYYQLIQDYRLEVVNLDNKPTFEAWVKEQFAGVE